MPDGYLSPIVVSMMDGDLFDKLEQVARLLRKNERPFGGMQVCTPYKVSIISSFTT
jgi:hypothetical protein